MAPLTRFTSFLTMTLASTTNSLPTTSLQPATPNTHLTTTLHQYPLGTWVENIALRPNGHLLVTTTAPHAELHQINPLVPPPTSDPAATLLHNFTTHTQCTGMSALEPDLFAVIADSTVYRVDLRNATTAPANASGLANVSPLANISDAGLLNGMAHLPNTPYLLIADSTLGLIWRLDSVTGNYSVAVKHETMSPTTDLGLLLGINGVRYLDGYVYYNNSPRELFCRVSVDPRTGLPTAAPEIIARGVMADDFAVREEGGAAVGYLAGLNTNVITRVEMDGAHAVVAGGLNSSAVAGASSAAFGRGGEVLYVTTGGGSGAPVNGTFVEGGKVVVVGGL